MNIGDFIGSFKNHPVLFVGTGISLRYLMNSFTWDGLLAYISQQLKGNEEFYLDIKSRHHKNGNFDYPKIATELEIEFNRVLEGDRHGAFKEINDTFYENMRSGVIVSRFKLYITELIKRSALRSDQTEEINALRKVRKNIGSVITTNYDDFIEVIFEFEPLIGNDILLSNPYGSVYKIHGCVNDPLKVIITEDDYRTFNERYELIRAQLLSLFIHSPIVFLGYNIGDRNIKNILKTIFTYIDLNTPEANKVRQNFLLVEYDKGSTNHEVTDHDIDIDGMATIRINKIKTDDYTEIYKHLANLDLPISAMDVKKVFHVVKEISSGGNIKVQITEDIESIKNGDKILAIGSSKTIRYDFQTKSEMMENYFKIIDESNHQLVKQIDKLTIQSTQHFPIFGFSDIQPDLECVDRLKKNQIAKIHETLKIADFGQEHDTIQGILDDAGIADSKKTTAIILGIVHVRIDLGLVEAFLRKYEDKKSTDYRKILCVYDYKKYYDGSGVGQSVLLGIEENVSV